MSLEEIFAQAILTGGVTILNCSVVIGSNAQVSDFLQNTAASNQNLKVDQEIKVDPRLKTEKAALIWKTLTEHIRKAADTMNIHLIDHVVVCEDGFFSFADEGLL
jgi:hypothetical protein